MIISAQRATKMAATGGFAYLAWGFVAIPVIIWKVVGIPYYWAAKPALCGALGQPQWFCEPTFLVGFGWWLDVGLVFVTICFLWALLKKKFFSMIGYGGSSA